MTPLKQCSKKALCVHPDKQSDGWLPATTEFFHRSKKRRDGFNPGCKVCESERKKQDRLTRPDEVHERDRAKYQNNLEHYQSLARKNTAKHRATHHEEVLQNTRDWREENRDHVSEYNKQYRQENPNKEQESRQARDQRVKALPNTFTDSEWRHALDYFGHVCAVCGRPEGDGLQLTPDHWVPLADTRADNPGTVAENIAPLCYGVGGCQGSKHAVAPETWLKRKFGEEKATEVLERVHAYFLSLQR